MRLVAVVVAVGVGVVVVVAVVVGVGVGVGVVVVVAVAHRMLVKQPCKFQIMFGFSADWDPVAGGHTELRCQPSFGENTLPCAPQAINTAVEALANGIATAMRGQVLDGGPVS